MQVRAWLYPDGFLASEMPMFEWSSRCRIDRKHLQIAKIPQSLGGLIQLGRVDQDVYIDRGLEAWIAVGELCQRCALQEQQRYVIGVKAGKKPPAFGNGSQALRGYVGGIAIELLCNKVRNGGTVFPQSGRHEALDPVETDEFHHARPVQIRFNGKEIGTSVVKASSATVDDQLIFSGNVHTG